MDQTPNQAPRRARGGDTRTPQAKQQIAQREEQIVQLRLRRIPFSAIARTVGVNKSQAVRGFYRALRRNTDQDIQSHHRQELADLEMEQAKYWSIIDAHKDNWKAQIAALRSLNMVHIRRARLLGLDAPTELDVSGIYSAGVDEMSDERRETQRVWLSMPLEEQARIYDAFDAARARLNAPVETTATVTIGPDNRNPDVEPPAADDES
jgi:hypothetical protein